MKPVKTNLSGVGIEVVLFAKVTVLQPFLDSMTHVKTNKSQLYDHLHYQAYRCHAMTRELL